MARSPEALSAGEWAVLALLAERPGHGFALARALAPEGEIGRVWSMRRPLVYHAVDRLVELGFIEEAGTEASRTGPRRTVLQITPTGRRALRVWLATPVEHVRDARSLLLLKLLFLSRRGQDPGDLLRAQRARFEVHADRLATATAEAQEFEQTLNRWRIETTTAAIRFIDGLLGQS